MELSTTLSLLRKHGACGSKTDSIPGRYRALVDALGPGWGDDEPIPLTRILDTNGLMGCLWALRAVPEDQAAWAARIGQLVAADCAESVMHLRADREVGWHTLAVVRRYAVGRATKQELEAAAAAAWARAARVKALKAAPWEAWEAWVAARAEAFRNLRAYLECGGM